MSEVQKGTYRRPIHENRAPLSKNMAWGEKFMKQMASTLTYGEPKGKTCACLKVISVRPVELHDHPLNDFGAHS